MRRLKLAVVLALSALALACLAACGGGASSGGASSEGQDQAAVEEGSAAGAEPAVQVEEGKHVIGVAVYDVTDSEVTMFYQYLVDYIAKVAFDDVQFVYSNSITSEDELLAFIDDVAALGGEGIMSFYNLDLPAEVERCASHGMYHIVASGTVSEEDFAAVEDNPYFLGVMGPSIAMEYNAGGAMVRNYVANKVGDRYFILSGGAPYGNEMHYQRTFGMLDTLKTNYGVDLGDVKELAKVAEPTTVEAGDITVTVAPGYISIDEMRQPVLDAFAAGEYDVVLAALPVAPIVDTLKPAGVQIAQVDCYSQDNQLLFLEGKLNYLAGKYGSVIGPSFAAMYNAVTGHAADFRTADGKAFNIMQNFWASADEADFEAKYEFASNLLMPAYNYEDLYSVCKEYNPDATLEDLETLARACSYEDARARRGM